MLACKKQQTGSERVRAVSDVAQPHPAGRGDPDPLTLLSILPLVDSLG